MARIWFHALVAICCGFAQTGVTSAAQSTERRDQASYFIQGAVRKPGVYMIEGSSSVLKLIALAGGLSETHGATAFIIRRTKPQSAATESAVRPGDEYNVIRIDIPGLLKGETLMNAELLPGDILNIPLAEVFFIQNEANRKSSFPLREGLTLSQAVSLARGGSNNARVGDVTIFRSDPGPRQEIKVNLADIISGKTTDILIKANDIIVIPSSRTGLTPRLLDAPPMRVLTPCRSGRPCVAGANSTSTVGFNNL